MNFLPAKRRRLLAFDLTPMIDVTMQLIIFFLLTSQFTQASRTEVDLPRQPGEARANMPDAPLFIDITADGMYHLEGRAMGLERLAQAVSRRVRGASSDRPVEIIVRADRSARASALNDLAARLTQMGVRGWKLATDPTPGGREP
jgi:biopolymer transport protein ExbD